MNIKSNIPKNFLIFAQRLTQICTKNTNSEKLFTLIVQNFRSMMKNEQLIDKID